MSSPFDLIFLDLDGTLVGKHDDVSPRNLAALTAAQQRGIVIVICTGRNRYMVERVAEQWTGHGYGVFANGAVIEEWDTRRVIDKILLATSTMQKAARIAHAFGITPLCFGVHVDDDGGRTVYADARGTLVPEYGVRNAERLHFVDDLAAETDIRPTSMGAYGTEAQTRAVADAWRALHGAELSVYHAVDKKYDCWCAFMNDRAANKANGAKTIAKALNISQQRTLAIGDELNDLELLNWAGIGVCMGGGHPDLLARADAITGSCMEDGVAQAIERFVLG